MKNVILLALTLALLASCASTDKLLEQGDYEALITKVTRKLVGHKKKDSYILASEIGFEKLVKKYTDEMANLRANHTARDWERILVKAQTLDRIQNLISPLLPLVSESGYKATFQFVNTNDLIREAKKNAAALYYTQLNSLVTAANDGDKPAARDAVYLIDHINRLTGEYDLTSLRIDLFEKGINNIQVVIEDRSYARLPRSVEDELYYLPINNNDRDWNRFLVAEEDHFYEGIAKPEVDYKVVLHIDDLRAEPPAFRTIENNYWKDVPDGWEYALDTKGNVIKDSLGNDIKKDRRIKVKGTVVETIQTKSAYLIGRMEVIDMKTGYVTYSRLMQFDDSFNQTTRNYFGDKRALEAHQLINVYPSPAPDNIELMMRVVDKAKREFLYEIGSYRYS